MNAAAEKSSGTAMKALMGRIGFLALLVVVLTGVFAPPARADIANCAQLRAQNPWQFLFPLMECFTAPDPRMQPTDPFGTQYTGPSPANTGLIPAATINFMNNTKTYFLPAVGAMATFLLAWFGIKLASNDSQNLKNETFLILFKIAGVYFFMEEAPVLYNYLLLIMGNLNVIINNVVNQAGGGLLFCNTTTLWRAYDCLMVFMAGAAGVGLAIIILLAVFTAGTGILIAFAFVYLMVCLFFTVARFAQVYLMAVVSLSLMFALGYLFVPLLFFKNTFHFFQKWLAMCLAYTLIPVVMYGYMGLMFVAMDSAVVSGQYSIFHSIFGQQDVAGMNPNNPDTSPSTKVKCPEKATQDDHGQNDTGNSGTGCNNNEHVMAYAGTNDAQGGNTKTDAGAMGTTATDNGIMAMQYRSWYHTTMFTFSIWTNTLDLMHMAQHQGHNKGPAQYLFDILYAFLVACLLAYIMYSLLSYIPDLASELVSQGTSAGKNVVKAEVFGEAMTKFALELVKETAIGALEGAKTGGLHGAALGAAKAAAQKTAEEGMKRANEMKSMAEGKSGEGEGGGGDKDGGKGGGGPMGGGGGGGGLGGALGGGGGGGGLGGALGGGGGGGGLGGALGGGGGGGGLGGALGGGGGGGGGDKGGGDKGGGK